MPVSDGSKQSRAEYYAWVERTTGRRHERLGTDKPPRGFEYIFELWNEIRTGSTEGYSGVKITWRDIAAYQDATGSRLDAFEREAVLTIDAAFTAALREERDGGSGKSSPESDI